MRMRLLLFSQAFMLAEISNNIEKPAELLLLGIMVVLLIIAALL